MYLVTLSIKGIDGVFNGVTTFLKFSEIKLANSCKVMKVVYSNRDPHNLFGIVIFYKYTMEICSLFYTFGL